MSQNEQSANDSEQSQSYVRSESMTKALQRVALEHVDVALYRASRGLDCEADLHKAKAALKRLVG
jgi:hypothetical protein